ncbi:MAG TPA: substrate-binding domain-containing protein [Xanthobacteraceae bacterium]|jgi:molybdate transport system substrate-binding protein|nr:substrate-binding domain-containing protein [Xanthobacteraceae bacterium]
MKTALYGIAAALAAVLAPAAGAAEIKVIASNAVREPYRELVPVFEKATGHRVTIDWGGTVDIVRRVGAGEVADIVIIPAGRIDDFVKQGLLVGRIDLARSGVGVAVRAGAPRPDVSSAAALRNTLLAARSIVLSSGPSSVYLPTLFQKMGIAEQIKSKIIQIGPGLPVGEAVARGEGEIGFTQISELMSVKGADYLGPLPADVQFITVFSAGLHAAAPAPDAARALIKFLTTPDAAPVLKRHGMEPG